MINRKRCRVDSPRPGGNNLRNGHKRLPRPRDPGVLDLHRDPAAKRAPLQASGLSTHPETGPAAVI